MSNRKLEPLTVRLRQNARARFAGWAAKSYPPIKTGREWVMSLRNSMESSAVFHMWSPCFFPHTGIARLHL